ncbi:MAG TPA: mechanosensitive ion channel family protein [Casimicrobiaceae bacterium]|nr:mechanosensitive ion channel family protein [Casimicrobiaceae bacterium]
MPFDEKQISQLVQMAWNWATLFLPRFGAAIVILAVGILISRWVSRLVRGALVRTPHVDPALKPIIVALVRYSILVLALVATVDQLGFRTTSLLAVLGAAGLAIGLALQGTLSNIAAGIMLLWLRPFQVLDYIEVAGQGGAVEEIGLFGCRLRTYDGLFLFLPNASIWNAPLKNHTRNGGRLLSIDVSVPPDVDVDRAKEALLGAVPQKEVLKHPQPKVFVENLSDKGLVLSLTLWSTPQGAGEVERDIIEKIKLSLNALGESFKPVQIMRTVPPASDPSRFLKGREPVPA